MQIGVLRLRFLLRGCRSLKEKRQRLGGLRDRFGKSTSIAVCESDYQDSHQHSEWTFVAVAQTTRLVDQMLGEIEQKVYEMTDAAVVGVARELR
jgi:uncharacterized protein YlxP (DUF503 family)